jgi:hypothetical protein
MDGSGLYTSYPVGRKVAVKLKGLWLGDYAKMIQLGAAVDRSDPIISRINGHTLLLCLTGILPGKN